MLPFALRSLDAQLAAVELLGDDGEPPEDVPESVVRALLKHRDIIGCLRRGVSLKLWSEAALPHSVEVMDAVPGLDKLSPMEAARLIADSANGHRPAEPAELRRRVKLRVFRTRLVGAIRKRAAA